MSALTGRKGTMTALLAAALAVAVVAAIVAIWAIAREPGLAPDSSKAATEITTSAEEAVSTPVAERPADKQAAQAIADVAAPPSLDGQVLIGAEGFLTVGIGVDVDDVYPSGARPVLYPSRAWVSSPGRISAGLAAGARLPA